MFKIMSARSHAGLAAETESLRDVILHLETTVAALLPAATDGERIVRRLRAGGVYTGERTAHITSADVELAPDASLLPGIDEVPVPTVDDTDPRVLVKTRAALVAAWQAIRLSMDQASAARFVADVLAAMDELPEIGSDPQLVESIADVIAYAVDGERLAGMRDEHAALHRETATKVAHLFGTPTVTTKSGVCEL